MDVPPEEPKKKRGGPRKRHCGMFKPGQSGNPGGRSKERDQLRRYIEAFGQEAVDGIILIAKTAEAEKVRLDAYKWLAEQAIGKPAVVDMNGETVRDTNIQVVIPQYDKGES